MRRLSRDELAADARALAPALLGRLLVHDRPGDRRVGRIVETEAYVGAIDPGAHSHRGRTRRNETMFGRPGLAYVYFTYGMHWCANVVCGAEGDGDAVLLRAAAPLEGLDAMRTARGEAARRDRDLCSGPAKLAQAFGLDGAHDGIDLVTDEALGIWDDETSPEDVVQTTRIGLSRGAEHPWRFYVAGDPNVSRP